MSTNTEEAIKKIKEKFSRTFPVVIPEKYLIDKENSYVKSAREWADKAIVSLKTYGAESSCPICGIEPDNVVKAMEQALNQNTVRVRESTLEEAVEAVQEHEIRDDSGGDYLTEDTELMREEIVQTLLELESNTK